MYKLQTTIEDWERSRKATTTFLRSSAEELKASHKRNAEKEHACAKTSLVADCIGLTGVFLAPFSGGLSLAAVGVSSVLGLGSFLDKRDANKANEDKKRVVERKVRQIIDEDTKAFEKVKHVEKNFFFFEEKLDEMEIYDVLLRIERTEIITLDASVRNIRKDCLLPQKNEMLPVSGLQFAKHVANLNAAMNSAEKVVKITQTTKEVFRGTRTIKQILSTAESVNKVTQTAKSLATAKQAAVMTIQASQSMAKSTAAFASVAKTADGVVKSAGVVSSAAKTTKMAVDVVTASGKAASVAKTVTNAAKAKTIVSCATKGADMTIKTVKNVKQVSHTVRSVAQVADNSGKIIKTTRITTNTARVSKISQTATTAASVSKLGLAINAVVIPFDIYNLMVASDNLHRTNEDVRQIEKLADSLEEDMKQIVTELKVKYDHIEKLHIQLCKVYKDHRIEVIYEFLQLIKYHFELDAVIC